MITVATLYTPNIQELGIWTETNKLSYCVKHGYKLLVQTNSLDPSRPPSWSKILLLQKELRLGQSDWILWIDADAVITNPDIKIETLIDPTTDLIISQDINGINAGVFLLRSCEVSKLFLEEVWNSTEFINHIHWEQAAMKEVLKSHKLRIKYIDKCLFNSYPSDWVKGDFILHVPGGGDKMKMINDVLEKI